MNPKKFIAPLLGFALFALLAASGAFAQTQQQASSQSAPSSKTSQAQPQVRFVWDYAQQLGLTQKQLSEIQTAFEGFQKTMIGLKAKLSLSEIDLQDLMDKNAELMLIHQQVEKSAAIEGDMRFAEIKMNHTVLGVLTPAQKEAWHKILMQNAEAAQKAPSSSQSTTSNAGK